jgi:putative flippase GtrA
MKSQFVRFVLGGGINTLLTYGLFLLLSSAMSVPVAYTITYVVGIALAYAINLMLVFKSRPSFRTAAAFPAIYGVQYLYGLCLISLLIDRLGMSRQVAMLVVIITSIPLTFVLTRLLLQKRKATANE